MGRNPISTEETITGIVMYPKSGKGNSTPKVGFPKSWMDALGVTEENPNIKKTFQDGKIIIEKEGD